MKITDIYSAKGLKIRLVCRDTKVDFPVGSLISIERSQVANDFFVKRFGYGNGAGSDSVICRTDSRTAEYVSDLLETERLGVNKHIFSVESSEGAALEVQAYTFKSVVEYKTPIYIQIADEFLKSVTPDKLYQEYVWEQLGEPALFGLNYKNKKKQASDVRFLSGKRYLKAGNTPRGIIAESENYLKDRDALPIDIYIAPEIKFVTSEQVAYANSELAQELDKISNPATYLARWEAYNALSKKLLEKEKSDFGAVRYTSCNINSDLNGITFEFTVTGELDVSCKGKELGVESITDNEMQVRARQIAVGTVIRIKDNKVTTYLAAGDRFFGIPEAGELSLYDVGDRIIMARRDAARKRMLENKAPIKYIVPLIEAGVSEYKLATDWGSNRAVTEELKRNYKKASTLNEAQQKALEIAINTPDIALIQGPPGTGKTTVIKAICERFKEIFEANERNARKVNPERGLHAPKILISSFQNEAVDNAISAPLPGDIPAYRKTARRAKGSTVEQYRKALDEWYAGVRQSISERIVDKTVIEFVEKKQRLSDEYLSYKNAGETPELAAELIRQYLSYTDISYPQEILDAAHSVIKSVSGDDEGDLPDPLVTKLESQRLEREAFEDDGQLNVKRLLAYLRIREDAVVGEKELESIAKVAEEDFTDDDYAEYVKVIRCLQKQFCKRAKTIDVRDKSVVNECLLTLYDCFTKQYLHTLSDIESKKSLILSEFLSRLEQEYETVVQKYAMTMAATCQTSLDLWRDDANIFDLVVIDEAARANPLDLFIPMSMGKKIILVGDHKQLPHMLEPDVLKLVVEDPKFKDLPEIEKSLFERLFDMFSKGQKPKAVLLTEQFRMHPKICQFVSDAFYDGQLKTSPKASPERWDSPVEINGGKPLTFVNIPYAKGGETPDASKSRAVEVEALAKDLKKILTTDVKGKVGIITFYSAQAIKIKQKLDMVLNAEEIERVEIGTVDAFQGKEFDYVMLSCVRSNLPKNGEEKPNVGFLEKPNRLCVAFSRAIKQLIVYGDMGTLKQIPCFSQLHDICVNDEGGYYREY